MQIDPKVEEPTRDLFGHALRSEVDDFQRTLTGSNGETLSEAVTLAATITTYVCIDVCGGEKPTDEEFRAIANRVAEVDMDYSLTSAEVYTYLAEGVFGGRATYELFAPEDAVRFPFIIGVYLLAGYRHGEQEWWDYLDEVEAAIETAPEPTES